MREGNLDNWLVQIVVVCRVMAAASRAAQLVHGSSSSLALRAATFLLVGGVWNIPELVLGRSTLFLSLSVDKRVVVGKGTWY